MFQAFTLEIDEVFKATNMVYHILKPQVFFSPEMHRLRDRRTRRKDYGVWFGIRYTENWESGT